MNVEEVELCGVFIGEG